MKVRPLGVDFETGDPIDSYESGAKVWMNVRLEGTDFNVNVNCGRVGELLYEGLTTSEPAGEHDYSLFGMMACSDGQIVGGTHYGFIPIEVAEKHLPKTHRYFQDRIRYVKAIRNPRSIEMINDSAQIA